MHVGIIGGGYAGLAAAVTLARRGVAVTLFETAKVLGGRARRVEHQGLALDNGQHIFIGAYRETLRLIAEVCEPAETVAASFLRLPLELAVYGNQHERPEAKFRLKAAALPAPLHLAVGLMRAQGAGFGERLAAARFMSALRRDGFSLSTDMSVAELLRQHRQGAAMIRYLWHPLCFAALNTPPEIASAQVFLNVLRDSLNGSRGDSELLLARVDLSALFPEAAAKYVEARGGKVLTAHTVTAIDEVENGFSVTASIATSRRQFEFSHAICALPPFRAHGFMLGSSALAEAAEATGKLEYQPIYTVYLQYPKAVRLPMPMLGLDGGYTQWVFDREALCSQRGLIAAVISAEGHHQELTQDELALKVQQEIQENFGPLPEPEWRWVVAEKRATFSCLVGMQRPPQQTPLRNFHLAGDYTQGDYPATIEGAVTSGIKCADTILKQG